jgi:hypothetical protein
MQTLEMKKRSFIKNQVVEAIITWIMEKVILFPFTHVYQPTLESDGAWGVWNQHIPNITYVVKFPFTEIFCCTYMWKGIAREHV